MSDPLPELPDLPLAELPDPRAVEERANARALHAEGIPMVLAVEDLRPGAAAPTSRDALGEVLADRLETYRAALRPDAADDDELAVHDVVVVLANAHGPVGGGT
ncbi:hypothetical protein [Angustibacter aerolatus]